MKLRMEKTIKSRNQFHGRHWSVKHKDSREWEWSLREAYRKPLPEATGRVALKITSVRHRYLDYDNLVGGCKGLVDALKRMGAIIDDSPKHVEMSFAQEKPLHSIGAQTIVEIKPLKRRKDDQ